MRKVVVPILLALVLAAAGGAWAKIGYGPVVNEDATVIGAGTFEFRADGTYVDLGDLYGHDLTAWYVEGRLDYGITDRIEVGARLPWVRVENDASESGLGDLRLDGKFSILAESETAPSLSLEPYVVLDTGDDEIVGPANDIDFGGVLAISKGFGAWNGHLNVGYLSPGEDEADNVVSYGVAAEIPRDTLAFLVEVAGSNEDVFTSLTETDNPLDAYVGVRKNLGEVSDLTGVVGVGLSDASPDWAVIISYRRAFGV